LRKGIKTTPSKYLSDLREKGYLTIQEVCKKAGVTRATVHHYLRLGLIPKPIRTSKTMAFYPKDTVERIRYIRQLQEKRFLPLKKIKEILKRNPPDFLSLIDQDVLELKTRYEKGYSLKEIVELHQVEEEWIRELIRYGILSPEGEEFSPEEERIVFYLAQMRKAGLNEKVGLGPDQFKKLLPLLDRLIEEEFAIFNQNVLPKVPPKEAGRLARLAVIFMSRILTPLHFRRLLLKLREVDQEMVSILFPKEERKVKHA